MILLAQAASKQRASGLVSKGASEGVCASDNSLTWTRASFKLIPLASCSRVNTSGYWERLNASSNASSCACVNVVLCLLLLIVNSSAVAAVSSSRFLFMGQPLRRTKNQRASSLTVLDTPLNHKDDSNNSERAGAVMKTSRSISNSLIF